MRKLILAVAVLFGTAAQANTVDAAAAELQAYRTEIKAVPAFWLLTTWSGDAITRSVGTCASAVVISAAAVTADTVPMTNPVAEWLASKTTASYPGIDNLLAWETWANLSVPGTAGGATVLAYEAVENWIKLTAGRKDINWEKFAQVYASTVAVTSSVYGDQSRCLINLAKVGLIRREVFARVRGEVHAPMTPMVQPR